MDHVNKQGEPKILKRCSLPLTGRRVVNRIISDKAVLDVTDQGLLLVELAPGETVDGKLQKCWRIDTSAQRCCSGLSPRVSCSMSDTSFGSYGLPSLRKMSWNHTEGSAVYGFSQESQG